MGVYIMDIRDIMHDINVASKRTMPNAQTLAQTYDLNRSQIIAAMEDRIRSGSRTKLTRPEREILIDLLVDKLVEMAQRGDDTRDAIAHLCQAEVELLEKAYPVSSINSHYLPKYTKALKEAIETGRLTLNEQNAYEREWSKRNGGESGVEQRHHAFDFLVYDYETQTALRSQTTKANNTRQDNLAFVELDDYLEAIEQLLQSDDPLELIVGIAGATGRRHTEVVSVGEFQLRDHPYLLGFAGQQKKADDVGDYDILTLLPAVDILDAIGKLREHPDITDVVGKRADTPDIQRINAWVNRGVQKLLGDSGIVPVLEGFKTVSIHRLRGLYGAIAIHFFCPQHQREHRFLQHYLGHVIEGAITPNSRATDHYFHYVLTRNGKPLNARGVKVAAYGLVPLQEERERAIETETETEAKTETEAEAEAITSVATDTLQPLDPATLHGQSVYVRRYNREGDLKDARQGLAAIDGDTLTLTYENGKPTRLSLQHATPDHTIHWVRSKREPQNRQPDGFGYAGDQYIFLPVTPASQAATHNNQAHSTAQETSTPIIHDILDTEQDAQATMINQQLIETLQTVALQQGRTIEAQAQTIAELHQQLQTAGRTSAEGTQAASNEAEVQQLREALQTAQATADAYRAGWQATADEFNAVRTAMGLPPVDGPQGGGAETPEGDTQAAQRSRADHNGTADRASDSEASGPYQRANAIWHLIQDWNTSHPDTPIMINQNLLVGRGIHREAVLEFLESHEHEIKQEHQRIGVTPDNERLFNRGKLKDFRKLLDKKGL